MELRVAVGRDREVVRLRKGGNLHELSYTPDELRVRVEDRCSRVLDDVAVPVSGVLDLAKGNLGTRVTNWIRDVEFYDDNVGWMVGGFGFIMNTSDGGKTWFRRIG